MARQRSEQKPKTAESPEMAVARRSGVAGGAMVVDAQGTILACTPEAGRLLRLSSQPKRDSQSERLPAALLKIVREAAATGKVATTRSIKLSLVSPSAASLQATALPFPAKAGRREIVVLMNEPGDAQFFGQDLRRLDRLANLGALSASIAHEIKNALVSIKTFVDLLLEKNRDDELVQVVRREMDRIDSIVGQMVRYAGPARPKFWPVRVHEILEHSLRMVQPQIRGRLISLKRAFNAAPDAIEGDDYQLEQVFLNVLLNAIEATGPNGSLTVATDLIATVPVRAKSASTAGAHVRVAIADTGIGITPENLKRLFEPFFTTKQQGAGLGLTIARRILHEHQGDISVQSQVNQGTTFNILLPVHAKAR